MSQAVLQGPLHLGMHLSRKSALVLLAVLLVTLLVGTQIPGAWRSALENSLHAPFPLAKIAHFFMFALIALVASAKPLKWPLAWVLLGALGLGLFTELLQSLVAMDRDGNLRDVAIDVAGAALGILSARRTFLI